MYAMVIEYFYGDLLTMSSLHIKAYQESKVVSLCQNPANCIDLIVGHFETLVIKTDLQVFTEYK